MRGFVPRGLGVHLRGKHRDVCAAGLHAADLGVHGQRESAEGREDEAESDACARDCVRANSALVCFPV